jgi:hypothetical protein
MLVCIINLNLNLSSQWKDEGHVVWLTENNILEEPTASTFISEHFNVY